MKDISTYITEEKLKGNDTYNDELNKDEITLDMIKNAKVNKSDWMKTSFIIASHKKDDIYTSDIRKLADNKWETTTGRPGWGKSYTDEQLFKAIKDEFTEVRFFTVK